MEQADTPQAYIDFEAGEGERERTRHLYERLLERTSHVKVSFKVVLLFKRYRLHLLGVHIVCTHGNLQIGWRRG